MTEGNIYTKLSLSEWNIIEQRLDAYDKNVLDMLIKHMKNISNGITDDSVDNSNTSYKILGDISYKQHISKTITKDYKLKTKDKIISDNTKTTVSKFLSKLHNIDVFISNAIPVSIVNFNILEFIGFTLMYQLDKYTKYVENNQKEDNTHVYKLSLSSCLSLYTLITNCDKILKTKSQTFLQESKKCLDNYVKRFNLNGVMSVNAIYKYAPHLLVKCDHFDIIPGTALKPRKSQYEVMFQVNKHLSDGALILYRSAVGSGKTTLIVPIASLLYEKKINTILLFCCSIYSVKIHAASLCYNSNLPFAMASVVTEYFDKDGNKIYDKDKAYNSTTKVKITKNNICNKDSDIVAIICDPDAALLLVQENKEKYILFIDELTIGLDSQIHQYQTNAIIKLLKNPTKLLILSSATMPNVNSKSIQYISKHFSKLIDIDKNEIFIGCTVCAYNGKVIIPTNEKNKLKEVIDKNSFLSRMYTMTVLELLNPDYISLFTDINHLNANYIKDCCIDILLNNSNINVHNHYIRPKFDINTLGTTSSHLFPHSTLIAVGYDNLINTTYSIFDDLLKQLPDIEHILNIYYKELDRYNVNKVKLTQSRQKIASNKNKLDKKELDIELENNIGDAPTIKFPSRFRINTVEHAKFYNKDNKIKTSMSFPLEEIDFSFVTQTKIKALLMCGVGIYSPHTINNSNYLNTVVKLMIGGKLPFVVSTYEICYGTNYPFNTTIITDSFSDNHSLNTLFQLMGRAGRVGKSWTAYSIVPDKYIDIFNDYIKDSAKYDIEEKKMYTLLTSQ